jgi:hypothetical protein
MAEGRPFPPGRHSSLGLLKLLCLFHNRISRFLRLITSRTLIIMNTQTSKLAELRLKTDRQLIVLIDGILDRGIAVARVLEGGRSHFNEAMTQKLKVQAEEAYREVSGLLPALNERGFDRRRLHLKLVALRDLLKPTEQARAACW